MMGFLSKLQARKELNRIEDRYVKRNNRNVWKSNTEYVNGEYVYKSRQQVGSPTPRSQQQKPASAGPRSSSSRPSTHSSYGSDASKGSSTSNPSKLSKRLSTSLGFR